MWPPVETITGFSRFVAEWSEDDLHVFDETGQNWARTPPVFLTTVIAEDRGDGRPN